MDGPARSSVTSASALDRRARLRDDLAVDADLPGEDQRPRPLARRGQAARRRAPRRASRQASVAVHVSCASRARSTQRAIAGSWPPRGRRRVERGERARRRSPPPSAATRRGRRARDRSACRRRRPCRRSCRDRADAPSTSRMSSTIWNASPSSEAKRSIAAAARRVAPAMTAPAAADARISAPVLRACIARSPSASNARARCRPAVEIDRLAADHAARAGGLGDDADRADLAFDAATPCRCRPARAPSARTPRSAGRRPRGSPCPSPKTTWLRRPSPPQRVVVHRRQIVVDQRVGVNELERAGRRQRQRARALGIRAVGCADRFGRGERQHRPQPLAAGEQAVAHRLADARRAGRRRRQVAVERRVDVARGARRASRADRRRVTARPVASASSPASAAGAGLISPRSLRISMRRSASSSFEWQKRDSCTPRSNSASDFSSARSPSSSVFTIVSSSAMADSKSLMVGSMAQVRLAVAVSAARGRRLDPIACSELTRLARHLSFAQRDADASPGATDVGAADDRRCVSAFQHDSVAAAEHGERAEGLEPSGERAEARVGALPRRRSAAAAAARRRASSRPWIAASRRRRSRCFEALAQRALPRARARDRDRASRARSWCVSSAACRPRMREPRREAGQPAPAAQQRARWSRRRCSSARAAAPQPTRQPIDAAAEFVLRRDHHLGRRRRRRRAQVGDEVGDRDVHLVADRRHDRHRTGGDRARDDAPR